MVSKVAIGSFISVCDNRNKLQKDLPVYGINKEKEFMPTVANMTDVDTSKYKILTKDIFAFNGMHVGRDVAVPIGKYNFDFDALISPAYTTFTIDESKGILKEYFEVFIRLNEFDRLGWYYCDSSVRGGLEWKRFLDIEIPKPSKEDQQKVVNVWKAFREIKEQNEAKAAPLMQLCQSCIQELKHNSKATYRIGKAIQLKDQTNTDNKALEVLGLNKEKEFMPTVANLENVSLKKYKVVSKGQFAFSGMQTGRDVCVRISLYDKEEPALISPAYTTFTLDEKEPLLPEYMMLVFKNPEMDRLGWFYSDSSVRSNLDWNRFLDIEIPSVPLDIQRAIVNVYKCANEAKQIAAEADGLSREVCPALLQHIIHSENK